MALSRRSSANRHSAASTLHTAESSWCYRCSGDGDSTPGFLTAGTCSVPACASSACFLLCSVHERRRQEPAHDRENHVFAELRRLLLVWTLGLPARFQPRPHCSLCLSRRWSMVMVGEV